MKLEKLRERLAVQAKRPDPHVLDLALSLRTLKQEYRGVFVSVAAEAGIRRRKAYYLAKVAEQLHPFLGKYRARMEEIGWTKLSLIAEHMNEENASELLNKARDGRKPQLEAWLRDRRGTGAPLLQVKTDLPEIRVVQLHLSEKEYEQFAGAIARHGGERTPQGLRHTEKALMRLIADKTSTGPENAGSKPKGRGRGL